MVKRCIKCKKLKTQQTNPGISYHKLPELNKGGLTWLKNLGISKDSLNFSKELYVCSLHFNPVDVEVTPAGKKWVRSGGMPSVRVEKCFPVDPIKRKTWLSIVGIQENQRLPKKPEICSDHFDPRDFITKPNGKRYIKPDAVPVTDPVFLESLSYSSDSTVSTPSPTELKNSPKNIREEKDPVPCKETPNVSRIQISNVHTVKDINNTNVIDRSFSSSIAPVPEEEEEFNFLTEVEELDNHSDITSHSPHTQPISPTRADIKDSSTANTMTSSPGALTNDIPAMGHVFLLPAGIVSNSNGIVQNVPVVVGQAGQPNNIIYFQPAAVPVPVGNVCSNNFVPVEPGPGNGGQGNLESNSSNISNSSVPDGNKRMTSFNTSLSAPHSSSRRTTSQINETMVLDDSDYDAGNSSSTLTASDLEENQKRSFPVYRYFGDCRYEDMDNRLQARKSLELGINAIHTMRSRFERAQKRNKSLRRDLKCMQELYRYFVETNFLQNFAEEPETEELENS